MKSGRPSPQQSITGTVSVAPRSMNTDNGSSDGYADTVAVSSHKTETLGALPQGTGTLGKALDLVDIVARADMPLRFTDILRQTDQPRGTLHRQLGNLVEEGLLVLNQDHTYALGVRLLMLAARTWSKNSLRSIAEPYVRELHEATGETVHLGVLNDLEVVYVDKLESRQSVRMHSQVGNASPLYCTGIGKAILASLDLDDAEQRARQFDFKQYTANTLSDQKSLLAELQVIRDTGISYDREEHELGIFCVAAGIESSNSGVFAGISVTAPLFRISQDTAADWAVLVASAARAIEKDIDVKLGPRAQE